MVCLLLGRPLHDIAYFPIQMQVIDIVSAIERRNKFSYIFNQEFGFYIGRFSGCGLFILLANKVSDTFALRYALLIVGLDIYLDGQKVLKGAPLRRQRVKASQPERPSLYWRPDRQRRRADRVL